MSDHTKAFVVILKDDLNDEQCAATCEALKHFRGVIGVEPHIHDIDDVIAEARARHKMASAIYEFLNNWK